MVSLISYYYTRIIPESVLYYFSDFLIYTINNGQINYICLKYLLSPLIGTFGDGIITNLRKQAFGYIAPLHQKRRGKKITTEK